MGDPAEERLDRRDMQDINPIKQCPLHASRKKRDKHHRYTDGQFRIITLDISIPRHIRTREQRRQIIKELPPRALLLDIYYARGKHNTIQVLCPKDFIYKEMLWTGKLHKDGNGVKVIHKPPKNSIHKRECRYHGDEPGLPQLKHLLEKYRQKHEKT